MLFRIADKNGRVGYIRSDGTLAIVPQFLGGGAFFESVAVVVGENRLFGVIDEAGAFKIAPLFEKLGHGFSEGLLPARKSGGYGFINHEGGFVIQPKYSSATAFHEGMASVLQEGLYGFVNRVGELAIEPRFGSVGIFRNGRAPFVDNGKVGFIDQNGDVRIAAVLDETTNSQFFEPVSAVSVVSQFGLVDRDGSFVVPPSLPFIGHVKNQRAAFRAKQGGKLGYMDERGVVLCEPKYDECTTFVEGLACAREGDMWCVVDRDIKAIATFRADEVYEFSDQMAMVVHDEGVGYIDQMGVLRVSPRYSFGDPFDKGLARVDDRNVECYVNREGAEVWRTGVSVIAK
jgi:hypothetical protein